MKLTKTMTTYQEINDDILNALGIRWDKFLNLPLHQYNLEDLEAAMYASESWVTCACGNQDARIPRDDNGCPKDRNLAGYGVSFMYQIRGMEHVMRNEYATLNSQLTLFKEIREEARQTLAFIEETALELLPTYGTETIIIEEGS